MNHLNKQSTVKSQENGKIACKGITSDRRVGGYLFSVIYLERTLRNALRKKGAGSIILSVMAKKPCGENGGYYMRCIGCGREMSAPGYCMSCGTYNQGGTAGQGYNQTGASQSGTDSGAQDVATVSSEYAIVPYGTYNSVQDSYGYDQSYGMYGYQQGMNGYQQGMNGYQQGMNGYQQGMNGYQQGMNGYQQGMNGYQQGMNNYQQGTNNYRQQGMNNYQQGGVNNYQQTGMNNNRQMGSNGYPQQGGTNGYQQQMGSNGYPQGPANGYGQNNRMGGLRPAPGNGMYHPNRKRNIIIGVISGIVVLTTVLLIVLLAGSAGAGSPEAAIRNYMDACVGGNAGKLLDAMYPSKCQKTMSETTVSNLKEKMSVCNGQLQDLEMEFDYGGYSISNLEKKIREKTKYKEGEFEIEEVRYYDVSFDVQGQWFRPSEYHKGTIKNTTLWDDYSFVLTCYKVDGGWYCVRE